MNVQTINGKTFNPENYYYAPALAVAEQNRKAAESTITELDRINLLLKYDMLDLYVKAETSLTNSKH